MKSLARIIPVLAAALLINSLPVYGAGEAMGQATEKGSAAQKDECLLVAKDCSSDSVNARVERIESEIAKGSAVYSDEELNKLQNELDDAVRIQQIHNNHFPPVAI
jgi:hypothetical protein